MVVVIKYFILMASIFPMAMCIQSESLAAAVHLDNPQARLLHLDYTPAVCSATTV